MSPVNRAARLQRFELQHDETSARPRAAEHTGLYTLIPRSNPPPLRKWHASAARA